MLRRRMSLGGVVWIIVGMIVAGNHHFLEHLTTLTQILSAILAVAAWPLVALSIHMGI